MFGHLCFRLGQLWPPAHPDGYAGTAESHPNTYSANPAHSNAVKTLANRHPGASRALAPRGIWCWQALLHFLPPRSTRFSPSCPSRQTHVEEACPFTERAPSRGEDNLDQVRRLVTRAAAKRHTSSSFGRIIAALRREESLVAPPACATRSPIDVRQQFRQKA